MKRVFLKTRLISYGLVGFYRSRNLRFSQSRSSRSVHIGRFRTSWLTIKILTEKMGLGTGFSFLFFNLWNHTVELYSILPEVISSYCGVVMEVIIRAEERAGWIM